MLYRIAEQHTPRHRCAQSLKRRNNLTYCLKKDTGERSRIIASLPISKKLNNYNSGNQPVGFPGASSSSSYGSKLEMSSAERTVGLMGTSSSRANSEFQSKPENHFCFMTLPAPPLVLPRRLLWKVFNSFLTRSPSPRLKCDGTVTIPLRILDYGQRCAI